MSFGILDLLVVGVMRDKLQYLSEHPEHVEFLLSRYIRDPFISNLVGSEYITEAIDFVTGNRITVMPFYELDIKRRPSISVISSGAEALMFLGDCGRQEVIHKEPPFVYLSFNASGFSSDRLSVLTSNGYNLVSKIWAGLWLENVGKTYKVVGVRANDDGTTYIDVATPIDQSATLPNWNVQSASSYKGYVISESMDEVTVQCKLSTTGHPSVHRLLSLIVRGIIKSSRLVFDQHGFQLATVNYSPLMATEEFESEFESVYTITGKFKDGWIDHEYETPTEIKFETEAVENSDTSGLIRTDEGLVLLD